jgi:hypothetical protein
MESFAPKGQSPSERRRTRRIRDLLGFAAAGCAVSAVLANPALAADSSPVEDTVATAAGVANNVVQSTPAADVVPSATPAPPPAAEPAAAAPNSAPESAAPDVAPSEANVPTTSNEAGPNQAASSVAGGGVNETIGEAVNTASKTVNDALPGPVGKGAGDLIDNVGKSSGAASPGSSSSSSALAAPLELLPKLTIAPILPASPILPGEPLLPSLLDVGGGPLAGLLPTLGEALGGLPTPGLDLGGMLGSGGQLTAPLLGSGTVPSATPPDPAALSGPGDQSGSPIDQTYGSHVLTDATGLQATPKAAIAPDAVLPAVSWDALVTPPMASTRIPLAEPAAPGSTPDHRPLPGPASPSGVVSPAPNGLLLFGFAAMLLAALAAAAPAIRRMIQVAPACWRPAPFVALLEPPG